MENDITKIKEILKDKLSIELTQKWETISAVIRFDGSIVATSNPLRINGQLPLY